MTANWECFCDECYFHLWKVRRVNERHFNQGFHVINKDAAEALVKLLDEADLWKAEAERWRGDGWQLTETAPPQ